MGDVFQSTKDRVGKVESTDKTGIGATTTPQHVRKSYSSGGVETEFVIYEGGGGGGGGGGRGRDIGLLREGWEWRMGERVKGEGGGGGSGVRREVGNKGAGAWGPSKKKLGA